MKIISLAASAYLAMLLGFSASSASAATLQFENVAEPDSLYEGTATYTESGYTLSASGSLWDIVSPTYPLASWGAPVSNSAFFSTNSSNNLILRNSQNSIFSLSSMDLGTGMYPLSANPFQGTIVSFHGLTSSGVSVNYDFAFNDYEWHTLSFSGNSDFQSLRSLTMTLSNPNNAAFNISLDNINVSSVPTPQSFYLFGSALLPLSSRVFRRKIKSRTIVLQSRTALC